jgi:segregation and condensation protein B
LEADLLAAVVEAILLTAHGPVTTTMIAEALGERDVEPATIQETLAALQQETAGPRRGVNLEQVAGGWRCVTPPHLDPYLQAFHGVARRQRLSQAALEVLAIVAHRQPVTLPEVNFIRGASSAGVVRTLLDRRLVRLAGRKQVVGKPFLYRTTQEFLIHFGLDRVEDLPDPEALLGDYQPMVESRDVPPGDGAARPESSHSTPDPVGRVGE